MNQKGKNMFDEEHNKNKYNKKEYVKTTYDRVGFYVYKGDKEILSDVAKSYDMSLSTYLKNKVYKPTIFVTTETPNAYKCKDEKELERLIYILELNSIPYFKGNEYTIYVNMKKQDIDKMLKDYPIPDHFYVKAKRGNS